jgi:hypothetical protein
MRVRKRTLEEMSHANISAPPSLDLWLSSICGCSRTGPLNAGFSDRCVARRGNTIVHPLLFPTSPNFSSALRRLYFGRANAIVRLRRNQNSAILPFVDQTEDQIKASENFKLIFLSAQSTHLDYMLVPIGSRVFTHLRTLGGLGGQKLRRHLKLPDSRRGCSQLLRVI